MEVTPAALAQLLPVKVSDIVFLYDIALDASFETLREQGAWKADKLPWQGAKVVRKPGREKWNFGVNVFTEGSEIKYQPFIWLDRLPPRGPLKTEGRFQVAGPVRLLDKRETLSVNIPEYPHLACTIQPAKYTFAVDVIDAKITPAKPNPTPQLAKSSTLTNRSKKPATYETTVSYEQEQRIVASLTERHSAQLGWTTTLEVLVGGEAFGGHLSTSIELKIGYEYARENTVTSEKAVKYTVNETVTTQLDPNEQKHVSLVLYADQNAAAALVVKVRLRGTLDGKSLSGQFLRDVAMAISDTNVIGFDATTVTYDLHGTIRANIVTDSQIFLSAEPPRVEGGQLVISGVAL